MDFHQLRIFVETAREKSFSRAAEKIFLSQPTVSIHIKALETEVGAPLFDRSRRELELTEAGRILYRYARGMLNSKDEAFAAIQKETRTVRGHVEIAASSVPGAYLLPQVLLSFREAYPDVTFTVLIRDTAQVVKSIKDYTYNLGFIGEAVRDEEIEHIRLMEDELIFITHPNCPGLPPDKGDGDPLPHMEMSSFHNIPLVLREPGSATRTAFERAFKSRFGREARIHAAAYMESQEAIKEAVKKGLGGTVISRHAVDGELKAGSIRGYRIKDLPMKRYFYLILRKKRALPPLVRMFMDYSRQQLLNLPGGENHEKG